MRLRTSESGKVLAAATLLAVLAINPATAVAASAADEATSTYAGPPVTLSYVHGFTGGDGPAMQSLVDDFNAGHSNIEIQASAVPWGDTWKTFAERVAAGQAPDIAPITEDEITRFVAMGAVSELTAEELAGIGVSESDYFAPLVDIGRWDGGLYGVPVTSTAFVMYYNKALMEEKGVADIPTTSDEFIAAAIACTTDDQGRTPSDDGFDAGATETWGINVPLPWPGGTVAYALLHQFGGSLVDGDLNAAFDGPAGLAALEYLVDLAAVHQVAPAAPTEQVEVANFSQGKTCFDISGVWYLTQYTEALGGDLGVAFVPMLGDAQRSWGATALLTLPLQRGDYDPDKRAAGLEFIRWITTQEANLAWTETGALPTRPDVASDPAYADNPMSEVAANLDKLAIPGGWPWVGTVRSAWDAAAERAMNGGDIQQALDDAADEANDTILDVRDSLGL